eukprot:Em0047g1a
MGVCAEDTAHKYGITRLDQDEYAKRSYRLAAQASEDGTLAKEIVAVSIPQKKGKPDTVVKYDEEYLNIKKEEEGGTVTAANASSRTMGLQLVC